MVLARDYREVCGGVVSLDRNIITSTYGDDIFFFIDNPDTKSMLFSINFGEFNNTVSLEVANLSVVHH